MRTFFSIFAFTGFFASILVHSLTFLGINAADYVPWVWVLHIGVFAAIAPLIGKDLRHDLLPLLPRWAKITIVVFMVYTVANFLLFLLFSGGGTPEIWDGKYVLHNHGRLIRELSEQEYRLQQAYVLRGFSGHWMAFYLCPAFYSWYRNE